MANDVKSPPRRRGFDQVRKAVGRTPEARDAEPGQLPGETFVVRRHSRVRQGEQADRLHPGRGHLAEPADELGLVPAFVQVGNQDEQRLGRVLNELLTVGHGFVDVRPAAELDAEDHVDRVAPTRLGQVDDFGVERDDVRVQGRQAGEDRPADRAVDDRVGHRPALVHVDDHRPGVLPLRTAVEVDPFRDDRAQARAVVLQVSADRPLPVDRTGVGQRRVLLPVECPHHGLSDLLFELLLDFLDDRRDDHPGRLLGPLGNAATQGHERTDELDVRLDALERFRLEQQLCQALPLDRVGLDDRYDVLLEVRANVAEPLGQFRGRPAEPGRPLTRLALGVAARLVVDGPEGLVHLGVGRGQGAPAHAVERFLGLAPEDQPPAAELFGIGRGGHGGTRRGMERSNLL